MEAPRKFDWAALLHRVRKGDDIAARRMVELLGGHIRRIVLNRLPRRADPEDLMQEIFAKIFDRLGQFRGKVGFEHWAARVALTTCFDHLRRQKARPEVLWSELGEDERLMLACSYGTDTDHAEVRSARDLLERLLTRLPPGEAWLIRKIDLEQASLMEVCTVTGRPHGATRVRLLRARRKLKSLFVRLEKTPV